MKDGIRIAAITSGPLRKAGRVLLVCAVMRQGTMEGVLSNSVSVDGDDSSTRIISMIRGSRFRDQVKLVALNGIAIAGLNVIDVERVCKALHVKFTIMTRRRPRKTLLIKALQKGPEHAPEKKSIIEGMSKYRLVRRNGLYFQGSLELCKGMPQQVFEALRVSHLIASGISKGESSGRI